MTDCLLSRSLLVAGLVWLGLLWMCPAARQAQVFYENGDSAFCDYRMPRICAVSEKVYEPAGIPRMDAPYPAFGYIIARLFPADTLRGGIVFTAFAVLLLAAGVWLFSRSGWSVAGSVFMSPVLSAIGVGNQILLTVGGVLVFLAWKDERGLKKILAFVALSAAGALKIVPMVFGLLLMKERRWRDLVLLFCMWFVLMLVPFVFVGGADAFTAFLENLRLHEDHYGLRTRYGFVPFDRCCRLLAGLNMESVRETLAVDRFLSVSVGLWCVWRWWNTGSRVVELLMLAAMVLLLPGVAQFYSAMYLLPAVLLWERSSSGRLSCGVSSPNGSRRIEFTLYFLSLCPLQVPVFNGGVNMLLTNVAFLSLVGLSLSGYNVSTDIPRRCACADGGGGEG